MKVRPLGDKILIKRAEAQGRTDAGIYLPESAKDKPREGTVVATGNGILNKETGDYMPFTVKKGDRRVQVAAPTLRPMAWQPVEALTETERGEKGFGSTGK